MNTAAPTKPQSFMKRLKKFDPKLDLEWLGSTWCIVDTSKPLGRFRIKKGVLVGNYEERMIYDRIYHIPEGYGEPDGGVINTLQSMRMERWARPQDLKHHLQGQLEKGEWDADAPKRDFADDVVSQLKGIKRFGVVVPGRRDDNRDTDIRTDQ